MPKAPRKKALKTASHPKGLQFCSKQANEEIVHEDIVQMPKNKVGLFVGQRMSHISIPAMLYVYKFGQINDVL
jgi:hypothetical protein